jgi:hypothetical protein
MLVVHQVLKGKKWSKHTSGAMFFQAFIITIRERSSCSMVSSGDFALRKTALSFECFVPSSRACLGKRIFNLAFKNEETGEKTGVAFSHLMSSQELKVIV